MRALIVVPYAGAIIAKPPIGCGLTGMTAGGLGYSPSGGLQEVTLVSSSLQGGEQRRCGFPGSTQ